MFNPNEKALKTCTAVLSQFVPDVIIEMTIPKTNKLIVINKILLLFIISSFRAIISTVWFLSIFSKIEWEHTMAVVCSFLYAHKHLAPKKAFIWSTDKLFKKDWYI